MKVYGGMDVIAPRIRNVGTTWTWVVIFTDRPLYPGEVVMTFSEWFFCSA
jgi:hypothetical protein